MLDVATERRVSFINLESTLDAAFTEPIAPSLAKPNPKKFNGSPRAYFVFLYTDFMLSSKPLFSTSSFHSVFNLAYPFLTSSGESFNQEEFSKPQGWRDYAYHLDAINAADIVRNHCKKNDNAFFGQKMSIMDFL